MKTWIITAIVIGLILTAGIILSATNLVSANDTSSEEKTVDCNTCQNSCTSSSNCGLKNCRAVKGESCGCQK